MKNNSKLTFHLLL